MTREEIENMTCNDEWYESPDNEEFNDYIDEIFEAFTLPYGLYVDASKIIFDNDSLMYREIFQNFINLKLEDFDYRMKNE